MTKLITMLSLLAALTIGAATAQAADAGCCKDPVACCKDGKCCAPTCPCCPK